LVFTKSRCYSCPILMNRKFSRHIFEAYSHIKFHLNPSKGNRIVPCGQTGGPTDRYDEVNCRSLHPKFCYTSWGVVLQCVYLQCGVLCYSVCIYSVGCCVTVCVFTGVVLQCVFTVWGAVLQCVYLQVLCYSVCIYRPGRVRKNGLRCWTHTYRESTVPRKWLVPGASSRHLTDGFSWIALLQLLHQHRGQCAVLCFQFLDASLQRHYLFPQTLHMTSWNILNFRLTVRTMT
jgi:hypothetical protein